MTHTDLSSSAASRISGFLGLTQSTTGLLAMVVLVGMGERMAERFLPIYILSLGGGAMAIGLLQAMDNLLSALYSFPGGYLSDRVGAKRSLMALGPLVGGVFIGVWGEQDGVRLAFGAALVMAVAALLLQQRMITDDHPEANPSKDVCGLTPEKSPLKLFVLMNPAMKGLLVTDILIRFCEQIPYAFVVVWCMKIITEPVTALGFGLLTTIEMATAVLIYIPVAYMADRSTKKPFVLITFVFFTIFPLVLLCSRSFNWLIVAFIVRGLKEFGEPTRKSLIMDLSPDSCKAGMFGLYYLIRDVFVAVAALGGAFLWQVSPETNLITAFGFGVVGTIGFAVFGRDMPSQVTLNK